METTVTAGEVANDTVYVPMSLIDLSENARPHTPEDLDSLAADMAKNTQLQEIVVMWKEGRFQVVAGVGRTLAARKLGWEKIRCLVKNGLSDFDRLHVTFSENEERQDVSPIYQAQLLNQMLPAKEGNQKALAAEIGKTAEWVCEYLGLLKFSAEVQKNLVRTKLNLSQLREIKKIDGDEAQLKAAAEVEGLTKTQTKDVVKKHLATQGKVQKTKKEAAELAWKGQEIAINRHFKPAEESAQDFLAWLSQTLPAFSEAKHGRKHPSGQSENTTAPTEQAIVEAIVKPVQDAVAVTAA